MKICEAENDVNAKEELSLTEEIGEITADSIVEFFRQEQTVDLINKLKTAQVNMKYFEAAGKDERFNGMTFVLTGSLENTREMKQVK
jgi:DNA ligase (NAD+)